MKLGSNPSLGANSEYIMTERKAITVTLPEPDYLLNLDGQPIAEAALYLIELPGRYPNHGNLRFNVEHCYEDCSIEIVANRLETDEELAKRLAKEEKQRAAWEKRLAKEAADKAAKEARRETFLLKRIQENGLDTEEYQQYLLLKKKFETK